MPVWKVLDCGVAASSGKAAVSSGRTAGYAKACPDVIYGVFTASIRRVYGVSPMRLLRTLRRSPRIVSQSKSLPAREPSPASEFPPPGTMLRGAGGDGFQVGSLCVSRSNRRRRAPSLAYFGGISRTRPSLPITRFFSLLRRHRLGNNTNPWSNQARCLVAAPRGFRSWHAILWRCLPPHGLRLGCALPEAQRAQHTRLSLWPNGVRYVCVSPLVFVVSRRLRRARAWGDGGVLFLRRSALRKYLN